MKRHMIDGRMVINFAEEAAMRGLLLASSYYPCILLEQWFPSCFRHEAFQNNPAAGDS
jgi:hypothetical protein